jgi:hypothetical protein
MIMEDDTPTGSETVRGPSPARLSKTPSWILLGFLIGLLFMWALPGPPPAPESAKLPPRTVVLERPKLTDIEAVFPEWDRYAVWEHDMTQIVLWDVEKRNYSICYEVLRNGSDYYYRSIPKLTRPILTHGVVVKNCPLLFTETEELRKEWLERQAQGIIPPDLSALKTTPGDSR